ncbi:unnamed protein product, partial [Symbiodinium sp. CCMP2592]
MWASYRQCSAPFWQWAPAPIPPLTVLLSALVLLFVITLVVAIACHWVRRSRATVVNAQASLMEEGRAREVAELVAAVHQTQQMLRDTRGYIQEVETTAAAVQRRLNLE